jgi:hypothetical protein
VSENILFLSVCKSELVSGFSVEYETGVCALIFLAEVYLSLFHLIRGLAHG